MVQKGHAQFVDVPGALVVVMHVVHTHVVDVSVEGLAPSADAFADRNLAVACSPVERTVGEDDPQAFRHNDLVVAHSRQVQGTLGTVVEAAVHHMLAEADRAL